MTTRRRPTTGRTRPRAGSVYLLVLAVSLIVTVIGLSAMVVVRLGLRASARSSDARMAEVLAVSAVEQAITIIRDVPTWRDDYVHDDPDPVETPIGAGFVSIRMVDLSGDEDLASGDDDPVRVFGIGRVGEAVRVHSVWVQPADASAVFAHPIHAAAGVRIHKPLTVLGGALSTNGTLDMSGGPLTGDAEAESVIGSGLIIGTVTAPAPPKAMPPAGVFSYYAARATVIPYVSKDQMQDGVLGPDDNPWGDTNDDGVYHVTVPGGEKLEIDAFRLDGTLLITAGVGAVVTVQGDTHLEPHRPDFPVLIARGAVYELELEGSTNLLSIDESFATGVSGLVHVIGGSSLTWIGGDFTLAGALISEGQVERDGSGPAVVSLDPNLVTNPPKGYVDDDDEMQIVAGSWRWEERSP